MTATLTLLLNKEIMVSAICGSLLSSWDLSLLKDQEVESGRSRAITFTLAGASHYFLSPCKPAQAWGSLCNSSAVFRSCESTEKGLENTAFIQ